MKGTGFCPLLIALGIEANDAARDARSGVRSQPVGLSFARQGLGVALSVRAIVSVAALLARIRTVELGP